MQKVDYEKLKTQIDANELADFTFQERRHSNWTENYQLYRDKVITNRLTQRQSINVPLMKGTIKTIMASIDEFPEISFEEKENNKDKEIAFNELWQDFKSKDKLELKDVIDKKQDLLYGLTWRKLNVYNGRLESEVIEPFDILKDRYADPTDIETQDHMTHRNIFRTISQLEANKSYDQAAVRRIRAQYATQQGLIKADENVRLMQAKNERLSNMGVSGIDTPSLGTTVVELKATFQKVFDLKDGEEHWHVIIRCEGEILMAKPMMETLNVDFLPFVTWSDDPDRTDHYPDGTADTVRTPNKFLNMMISSLAENRVMRNYGMQYYDSTKSDNWTPNGFEPRPFGWYGVPGNPKEFLQKVDIPDMSESIDEMEYVKSLVESATAATAQKKGDSEGGKITLGEVELITQAANERISSISKFYLLAQKDFGDKWAKLMNANATRLDAVKLYKKSHKGNLFSKTVKSGDWKSTPGYECRVVSTAQKEKESTEGIQKLNAVKAQFPGNLAMDEIYKTKLLEFGKLSPDEKKQVMDEEKQKQGQMQGMPMQQPLTQMPNVANQLA